MEEDIKILEQFLYGNKLTCENCEEKCNECYIEYEEVQAVARLIKGYRELEEYIKRLDELNARDFILKSTIEEKIEEYKIKIQKTAYTQERRNRLNCKIQVLQELMEDK